MFFVIQFCLFFSSLVSLSLQRIVPVCFKIEFLSSYRRKKAKSTRKWAEKCENLFSVHRHFFSFHIITLAHIKCLFKIFLLYFCANVNDVERCNNAREPHNIFHPFNRNKCDVKIVMEIEWLGRFSFSLFSTLTAPSAKIVCWVEMVLTLRQEDAHSISSAISCRTLSLL